MFPAHLGVAPFGAPGFDLAARGNPKAGGNKHGDGAIVSGTNWCSHNKDKEGSLQMKVICAISLRKVGQQVRCPSLVLAAKERSLHLRSGR
jgi:hypothetical protein